MDNVEHMWTTATHREREMLADVYARLLIVDRDVPSHVQFALCIEVVEDFDHRSWPEEFNVSGLIPDWQEVVSVHAEQSTVDWFQRKNYMKLAMAGKDRHNDVAYGLSEKLRWDDKENVLEQLMAMGKRQYTGAIPNAHEMDNNVLHVAVSYRHTTSFDKGGTINRQQAEAVWTAVRAIPLMESKIEVRVWVDQNLHRKKFPEGTEWHEFGLLPYACLSTVIVGDGDFSLRHAYTRPWLWVEMVTALKGDGIHTAPGYDVIADCNGVLSPLENYDQLRPLMLKFGWVLGAQRNVDTVMSEIALYISLWRRRGFMGHTSYQYADDFEKFVNWARLFVIRGVPYSEMTWNHSSDKPVQGMDSIALIRAFPREGGLHAESLLAAMQPHVSWACHSIEDEWVLGDLVDRSKVDNLPLRAIVELAEESRDGLREVVIKHKYTAMRTARFKKENGTASIIHDRKDQSVDVSADCYSKYSLVLRRVMNDMTSGAEMYTLEGSKENGNILSYRPFTLLFSLSRSRNRLAVGSATLRPAKVSPSTADALKLKSIGFFYDKGICEEVYEMRTCGSTLRLSTTECRVLLHASRGSLTRLKEMAMALKQNYMYKTMWYRDFSEKERHRITRGWRLDVTTFSDQSTLSGDAPMDVERQFFERLRARKDGSILVWVDQLSSDMVRVIFRNQRQITIISTRPIHAKQEVAVMEDTDLNEMATIDRTGLVQMAIGMEPKVEVIARGAGLNPNLRASEDGQELYIRMVRGLFVRCSLCNHIVCQLNGLRAEVARNGDMYHVNWDGNHTCEDPEYIALELISGIRIA